MLAWIWFNKSNGEEYASVDFNQIEKQTIREARIALDLHTIPTTTLYIPDDI